MCGIAGAISFQEQAIEPGVVERMVERIRHRGPDDAATMCRGPVAFGHARLAIVDVAGGKQPMTLEEGACSVVFNGEIFNHVELRGELESKGHRFVTRSDTEVLLRSYLAYGHDCVERFNGQWAFAIWDERSQELFCSRDRVGARPFYYAEPSGTFVFASEIKALFAHPKVPRALDPIGLDQVFTIWTTVPPRSVFQGVAELAPGHSMVRSAGGQRTWAHSVPSFGFDVRPRAEAELIEELRVLLMDATRLRLERSDVPVAAYLSGGLDSTLITALARQRKEGTLRTFSIAFDEAEYDERAYQSKAALELGVAHEQLLCTPRDIRSAFPRVVWHAEQPLLRTAPAPMFLLAKFVREHGFKVVLTGEGADELFGGYDLFKEAKVRWFCARSPESRMRPRLFRKLYPYMPLLQRQNGRTLQAFFHAGAEDLAARFFSHEPRWRLTEGTKLFYSEQMKDEVRGYSVRQELEENLPPAYDQWHPFCQAQYPEFRYLLPGYLLSSQGDRQALAHGVEARYPFLDYRVIDFASRLSPTMKMNALQEKYLLKKAFEDVVPGFIAKRKKQPYRAPDVASFFGTPGTRSARDYVGDLLSETSIRRGGVFDPGAVRRLTDKARQSSSLGTRNAMALVGILSTQLLLEHFVHRLEAPCDA